MSLHGLKLCKFVPRSDLVLDADNALDFESCLVLQACISFYSVSDQSGASLFLPCSHKTAVAHMMDFFKCVPSRAIVIGGVFLDGVEERRALRGLAEGAKKASCGENVVQKGVLESPFLLFPLEVFRCFQGKPYWGREERTLQKHPSRRPFPRTTPSPLLWRAQINVGEHPLDLRLGPPATGLRKPKSPKVPERVLGRAPAKKGIDCWGDWYVPSRAQQALQ